MNDNEDLVVDANTFDETGAVSVSGTVFANSRWADFNRNFEGFIEINLGRGFSRFQTAIGIDDTSDSATAATFTIFGDGVQLLAGDVGLGQLVPVDLPVDDVLRLRVEYQRIDGYGRLVLGNPALIPASTPSSAVATTAPVAGAMLLNDSEDLVVDANTFDETGAVSVSGTTFVNSRWADFNRNFEGFIEINLGRGFSRFQAAIGIDDTSDSATAATFTIFGDGIQLLSGDVALGQLIPVDLAVDDILRLRIEYQRVDGYGRLVLGNPALIPAATGA